MPRKLIPVPLDSIDTLEQKWVREHGETFKNYAEAARQLGVHEKTVGNLVRGGYLQTTPHRRVLVRSAAAWANSNIPKRSTRLNASGWWL